MTGSTPAPVSASGGAPRLFATVPPPERAAGTGLPGGDYRAVVRRAARLAEQAGYEGALVYSDNNTVDPWTVAQELLTATERFAPLVALQPVYAHPYTVAKTIASLALLHGRRVCLNLVAGGNRADLAALGDTVPHDDRYRRLGEYARTLLRLLDGGPVHHAGDFYRVDSLTLFPPLPPHLRPELFVSGSSPAGRETGRPLGAVSVTYPVPGEPLRPDGQRAGEADGRADGQADGQAARRAEGQADGRADGRADGLALGVRIGVLARETEAQAWQEARRRFPDSRAGRMLQGLARRRSDSEWVARLSAAQEFPGGPESPYWMGPFHTYATFCPYLVGERSRVAAELARYLREGCRTFILDTARDDEDYAAVAAVFAEAAALAGPAGAQGRATV
ncbi:LLM class flavin-dependent oxidoreductase [Streptomyces sp. NPDC020996]|uniref:LLM class flavin-dependent oxidoreductase n=1 Tax=Streptomyces sp. NPDC020996 TaxID=3154791 RepID=UPI0033DDCB84